MRRLAILALLIFPFLMLSCRKDLEVNVIGEWDYVAKYEHSHTESITEVLTSEGTYNFNEDGTGRQYHSAGISADFTWSIQGQKITTFFPTIAPYEFEYNVLKNKRKSQEWTTTIVEVYDSVTYNPTITLSLSR